MHRSRTALSALALAAAVTACGAQPAARTTTAPLAAGTTSAAPTTSSAAVTMSAAVTTSAPVTTSAAPTLSPTTTSTAPATRSVAPRTTSASPLATVTIADSSVRPHFNSPEAAMRYLAAAWNANDTTALKHVTQGQARMLLMGMKTQAVDLRLDHCSLRDGGGGDYLCHFVHDYPASYPARLHEGPHGTAEFIAAPSSSVGWYMFAYEGCG